MIEAERGNVVETAVLLSVAAAETPLDWQTGVKTVLTRRKKGSGRTEMRRLTSNVESTKGKEKEKLHTRRYSDSALVQHDRLQAE